MSKQPLEAEEMLAVRQAAGNRRRAPSFQENPVGAIFNVFPLILIPVLIYNIWAFGSTAVNKAAALVRQHLDNPIMCVPMASQEAGSFNPCTVSDATARAQQVAAQVQAAVAHAPPNGPVYWMVSFGDLMVLLALLLLFIELLKSTSTGTAAIFNHALSMLVFIICLVEFLLSPAFATTTFFLIMIMSLLDVLAGVVVTIVSARRDVEFAGQR